MPFIGLSRPAARISASILTVCQVTQSIRKVSTQADFVAVYEANAAEL
jgi:hypothetical protein